MILKQYYLGCLSHASYMVADEASGVAAVVDPQRDVEQYLEDAEAVGLSIRWVILTHFHADFVAGHLELRDRAGARIALGARARAEYPFHALHEGDTIEFGRTRLQVLETPGHTPEAVSLVVYDLDQDPATPHAVLTGDTLFLGDVGRPDLLASAGWTAQDLAGLLYDSLHRKLLRLPDATLVYPAHGGGSLCGKNMSRETVGRLGDQRATNHALRPMSREAFVRLVTTDLPELPPYFAYDADLNRRERATLDAALQRAARPMSLDDVLAAARGGTQVLDARDPAAFAAGHLAGSVHVGLSGRYATWAGTILDRERPIAIVAEPDRHGEAAMRLGRIGFDRVVGHLEGGAAAFSARPDLLRRYDRVAVESFANRLRASPAPRVVDVRTPAEWAAGHIEGSVNVSLQVLARGEGDVPRDLPLAIHCQTGYRSAIAASLLEARGIVDVIELDGGIVAWQSAGHPCVA